MVRPRIPAFLPGLLGLLARAPDAVRVVEGPEHVHGLPELRGPSRRHRPWRRSPLRRRSRVGWSPLCISLVHVVSAAPRVPVVPAAPRPAGAGHLKKGNYFLAS